MISTVAARRVDAPDFGSFDPGSPTIEEDVLFELLDGIFFPRWHSIRFDISAPGSAWEHRAPNAPAHITLHNDALAVDFEPGQMMWLLSPAGSAS